MICAKPLAAAAALAGLLAAGCGSKPTPKPTAPPEAAAPTKADKAPRVTRVGFAASYPNGWSANTCFGEDLRVSGGHMSGGPDVTVHLTEDKASPELWARLSELAMKASSLPMRELQPRPEKVYAITMNLSDGRNLRFETALDAGYQDAALQALADLLHANERVYSYQQSKGWKLDAAEPAPAAGPKISEQRAREIALKELAAKHPHTKWRLDKLELIEGRVWRGRAGDAEPKPAMAAADVEVDAQTGQATALRLIPGR
jgi:predicted outer membrane protein